MSFQRAVLLSVDCHGLQSAPPHLARTSSSVQTWGAAACGKLTRNPFIQWLSINLYLDKIRIYLCLCKKMNVDFIPYFQDCGQPLIVSHTVLWLGASTGLKSRLRVSKSSDGKIRESAHEASITMPDQHVWQSTLAFLSMWYKAPSGQNNYGSKAIIKKYLWDGFSFSIK